MDVQPQLITIESFTVTGLTVRTKNENECNPKNAKIPELWQNFHSNVILTEEPNSPSYAIYSNYASDVNDWYSVTAGKKIEDAKDQKDLENIQIVAGDYLVFSNNGDLPQAIIELWQGIWRYFESSSKYKRKYLTDFEIYLGPKQCAVYIGV